MKKLMLSIATALALTGCGGDSDSPAATNNNGTGGNNGAGSSINAKLYSYEFGFGEFNAAGTVEGRAVIKSTLTVESGIAYEKEEYPVKTAGFQPYDEDVVVFLTQDKLYEPDSSTTPLGLRIAFVDQLDDKGSIYTPYNLAKDRNLKFTTVRQKVDLSGKKLGDVLFLNQSDDLIKPIQQGSAVFPQGSVCWRESSSKPNKDVLGFSTDDPTTYPTLDAWMKDVDDDEVVKADSWAGIPWASSTYPDGEGGTMSEYGIQYKGKIYFADMLKANQPLDDGREVMIARYETKLATPEGAASAPFINAELNVLKNSCDDFNQVAADAIDVALASITVK